MYRCVGGVSVCVCVCVCFMKTIDNALAQVLFIIFSYIHHRLIKQIAQIKINKSTQCMQIVKICKKPKVKCD